MDLGIKDRVAVVAASSRGLGQAVARGQVWIVPRKRSAVRRAPK
jgi:hypothetical protein